MCWFHSLEDMEGDKEVDEESRNILESWLRNRCARQRGREADQGVRRVGTEWCACQLS